MATISDELASALTKILQISQLDLQNLDKLFNGNGDVSVTRADGTVFVAATWAKMMAATVDTIKKRGNLGVNNLNELNGTFEGFWFQNSNANATTNRNYPVPRAGSLVIMQNAANTSLGCTQMYFVYDSDETFIRTGVANASGIASWSVWKKIAFTDNPVFTGKVVMPNAVHIREGQAIIKSNAANQLTFTVGGTSDICQIDGDGIYNNRTFNAVGGYASRRGINTGSAFTGNYYGFGWEGEMKLYVDNQTIGALAMKSTSDRQLKKLIKYKPKKDRDVALNEVMQWATATFKYKGRGDGLIPESDTKLGFIANDLKDVSPECVEGEGLKEGDELDPTKAYILDPIAMMAKMTMAMQAQQDQITALQNTVDELKTELKA